MIRSHLYLDTYFGELIKIKRNKCREASYEVSVTVIQIEDSEVIKAEQREFQRHVGVRSYITW